MNFFLLLISSAFFLISSSSYSVECVVKIGFFCVPERMTHYIKLSVKIGNFLWFFVVAGLVLWWAWENPEWTSMSRKKIYKHFSLVDALWEGICVNKSNFAHPLTERNNSMILVLCNLDGMNRKKIRNPSNLDMVKTKKIDGMLLFSQWFLDCKMWANEPLRYEHKSKRHPIVLVMRIQTHTERQTEQNRTEQNNRSAVLQFDLIIVPVRF